MKKGFLKIKVKRLKINKNRLLFFAIISLMVLVSKTLNVVMVNGVSMQPTYQDKYLLTSTPVENNDIKLNDCVVFKYKDILCIKRVVGLPKDILQIKNGHLYRNDKEVNDKLESIKYEGLLKTPYTVKENEYFCMGDNRNHSLDSREFGSVNKKDITHKITGEFLPFIFNLK